MSGLGSVLPTDGNFCSQTSNEMSDMESLRSQDVPNSTYSPNQETGVQRLKANYVSRLEGPEPNHNRPNRNESHIVQTDSNIVNDSNVGSTNSNVECDSVVNSSNGDVVANGVENLNHTDPNNVESYSDSTENATSNVDRPKSLGNTNSKFNSSLVLTTSHPLMSFGSPDDFPDVVPKKAKDVDKELSFSSLEDDKHDTNGYEYYPSMNNSKNNLYFSENFVTAESQILDLETSLPPDVARVEKRRKIIPKFTEKTETVVDTTPHRVLGRLVDANASERGDRSILKYIEERQKILSSHSTPKQTEAVDVLDKEFCTGVAEWCESPSQLRSIPNFQLPIELSTDVGNKEQEDPPSPDASSSSAERSAFEARVDPRSGRVALRPSRPPPAISPVRRRIQLPPEEDRCSVDSDCASLESEEEPPDPTPETRQESDEEDSKRSSSPGSGPTSSCSASCPLPEYSAAEELRRERGWRAVDAAGVKRHCDMKVIEPYARVVSHGGYDAAGAAIIVCAACHLPDAGRPDYDYVMDNLFLYVTWTVERLVSEEYVLVYLHGSARAKQLPSFRWLHHCYRLLDRRLRKSLKHLYLVHPTFWLKCFVVATKPFVSSKFFRKLSYVRGLSELSARVPLDPLAVPAAVHDYDSRRR